jgi:hypothetical protein
MRASLAVALREYNGRASQWRHFAALREDSAISRDNEPYSVNRKSACLHDSRRITQFECPNLSEKLGARISVVDRALYPKDINILQILTVGHRYEKRAAYLENQRPL